MKNEITDIGDFGYEMYKNGHFWKTYIYKKDTESNYLLISVVRSLIEPDIGQILENMDQTIPVQEQDFYLNAPTANMI